MDPVSAIGLAASIVQIINATAQTIQFLNDVKDAPKDRIKLLQEAAGLLGLLTSLRCRIEEANQDDPWYVRVRALEGPCLDQYRIAMEDLAQRLRPEKGVKSLGKRLIWTFDKKQIRETLETIERLKSLISLAIQEDNFALSLAIKNDVATISNGLRITSQSVSNITEGVADLKSGQDLAFKHLQDERHQRIVDWLSPLNMTYKHNDTSSRRQAGTGLWLLEHDLYKAWLVGTERVLWCQGIPGAGKTVLTSMLVDSLERDHEGNDIAILYLYLDYREQDQQSTTNLFGSLLQQLVRRWSSVQDEIVELHREHASKKTRPTANDFLRILQSEMARFSKVFMLVDALDECTENNDTRDAVLTNFQHLLSSSNAHLLTTSRHVIGMGSYFPGAVRLEIRASDIDIRKYLEAQILKESRLARHISKDASLQELIVSTIIDKAEGMFLMAQLHLHSLASKNNKRGVRLALDKLPRNLDTMYDETMKRIEGQENDDVQLAKRTLVWISCAIRPLTALELRHALAIEPDTTELDEEALPDEEIVISVCAGLVTIDQETNIIRLVHYTTQEYLQRRRDEYFPTAQKDISRTCLTYLSLNVFFSDHYPDDDEEDVMLRENVFLDYASRNWSIHAAGEPEKDPNVQQLALKFLEHPSVALGIVQNRAMEGRERFTPELVYLAALGLTSIVEVLVARGCRIDVVDEYQYTALHYAAENGHECTLSFLLRIGPQLVHYEDDCKNTPLHLSALTGHEAVSRTLCEHGAVVDAKNKYSETALHEATSIDHVGLARLLLKYGADVDAQNDNENAALHVAAYRQKSRVLPILLEYGAKVKLRGNNGRTALFMAARSGEEDNAQMLLDAGADVNAKVDSGATALHFAARKRTGRVLPLLLKFGAKVNLRGHDGRTALMEAVRFGEEDNAQMLLDAGADVNAKADSGATALHFAALYGHIGMVLLLLDAGADIEAVSKANVEADVETNDEANVETDDEADVEADVETDVETDVEADDEADVGTDVETDDETNDETVSEASFTWSAGTALKWAEQEGNSDIVQILKEAQTRRSTAITQADI